MGSHLENRRYLLDFLKKELVGPFPCGREIDCTKNIVFDNQSESFGPWCQQGTGEEILVRDTPRKRYGVGVLYPRATPLEDNGTPEAGEAPDGEHELPILPEQNSEPHSRTVRPSASTEAVYRETDSDDFDLSTANSFRPSSMGASFLIHCRHDSTLKVEVTGGRYRGQTVTVEGKEYTWWLRSPVSIQATFAIEDMLRNAGRRVSPASIASQNLEGLDISIDVISRKIPADLAGEHETDTRLITVSVVNRASAKSSQDEASLFQSYFKVTAVSSDNVPLVLSYPSIANHLQDPEEQSLALLYRDAKTYAVGHGCAVDWGDPVHLQTSSVTNEVSHASGIREAVVWVSAEPLPAFETPSITPDIARDDGSLVEVSMAALAGLLPEDDGFAALEEVISLYESWIEEKKAQIPLLPHQHRTAAARHMDTCQECASRMHDGMQFLKDDPSALQAFRLANHAILLQQIRPRSVRRLQYQPESTEKLLQFTQKYIPPDPLHPEAGRGSWRPFQIAFLLMSLRSTARGEDLQRRTVELIWFPTGGGKTEAYLGLASFAMFYRRLQDRKDAGVNVLMRYTLRLLTAQQFQRASALLCAMELLRRQNQAELGEEEFSIGIWLGGTTTPNSRSEAVKALRSLRQKSRYAENPFILTRCPWCSGQIGPLDLEGKIPAAIPRVVGYNEQGTSVIFKCFDSSCDFVDGLPVYVIDEDIYELRPSLVIGTVDKFAMLAWRPDARALFGIGKSGERDYSPPGLIIQDELHLISGPLGSMVGLYETVIEELCTDRRQPTPISPKIISSTATIRRYEEQIKALYARNKITLFPPPGLEAGDSFFSRYAKDSEGKLQPGRIYAGVHAPGLSSMQTVQVRTFSSLLQAPVQLPNAERDPWWTLLVFFNSLRELGTTLSLFQSDIPDYFLVLKNRLGLDYTGMRKVYSSNVLELTSRLRNDEVPNAISALEVTTNSSERCTDVCLASSIIEVGIDIDRLSLMAVVGQPKTTSQYIQVTGRVGRRWWERPGLVVTLYGASKPRDRSHFEKFRSYHERLYAQVEPTSVTPFSPPVLDRALHAIMAAYVRQAEDTAQIQRPYPYPKDLLGYLRTIILNRIKTVDPLEVDNFKAVFDRRMKEWRLWEPTEWSGDANGEDVPLMVPAGSYVPPERRQLSWFTPMSMRNVDAECQAAITQLYKLEDLE